MRRRSECSGGVEGRGRRTRGRKYWQQIKSARASRASRASWDMTWRDLGPIVTLAGTIIALPSAIRLPLQCICTVYASSRAAALLLSMLIIYNFISNSMRPSHWLTLVVNSCNSSCAFYSLEWPSVTIAIIF